MPEHADDLLFLGLISGTSADGIDAADLVMRFNDCRSVGPGGGRTDIVTVCNTGRPGKAMTEGSGWACNKSVWLASTIWCIRDPAKFKAMKPDILRDHPELDDFCDDYTAGFATFARVTGRALKVIPQAVHKAVEAELAAFDPSPYVVPSSGLIVIAHVLANVAAPGDRVSLAGFGHEGWQWHPFAAERRWTEAQIAAGRLARLEASKRDS